MNERYLSRGKLRDNGERITGYYVFQRKKSGAFGQVILELDFDRHLIIDIWGNSCEVIPETVEQCTGLKDKNGKLIFEGDIVITNIFNTPEILYTITYDKQIAAFIGEYVKGCIKQFTTFDGDSQCFEVIGNIHDNPELLEVER